LEDLDLVEAVSIMSAFVLQEWNASERSLSLSLKLLVAKRRLVLFFVASSSFLFGAACVLFPIRFPKNGFYYMFLKYHMFSILGSMAHQSG
jgi:hypothetical protein